MAVTSWGRLDCAGFRRPRSAPTLPPPPFTAWHRTQPLSRNTTPPCWGLPARKRDQRSRARRPWVTTAPVKARTATTARNVQATRCSGMRPSELWLADTVDLPRETLAISWPPLTANVFGKCGHGSMSRAAVVRSRWLELLDAGYVSENRTVRPR